MTSFTSALSLGRNGVDFVWCASGCGVGEASLLAQGGIGLCARLGPSTTAAHDSGVAGLAGEETSVSSPPGVCSGTSSEVTKIDDASSEAAPLAPQLLVAVNSAWLDLGPEQEQESTMSLSADEAKLGLPQ